MEQLERELLAATPSLRRLALSLVNDEHVAGDLVQEAWLAALRRRGDSPRDPARWAHAVVRRLLYGLTRSSVRRRTRERLSADARLSPAPDTLLEQSQTLRGVASAAAELDEPYRTVIRLRYWEDLSPPEIAARLDRPIDTVKTQLRRGLESLRERLDREHGEDRTAWTAPLLLLLDVDELQPASAGFPVGAVAGAAAVTVALWFGWALLRGDAAVTTSASVPVDTLVEALDEPAPVSSGDRTVAPADAVPPAALPPNTATPPRLAVTVVDALGNPVSGAEVHVARAGGFRPRGRTDEHGVLEIAVEEDELGISAAPELADRVIVYAYKPGYAASLQFMARCAAQTHASLRLMLPGTELVIRGLVTDAAERPIVAARVVVESADLDRRRDGDLLFAEGYRELRTDDSGWFTLTGLSPGVHALAVDAPGWVPSGLTVDGREGGEVECAVVLRSAGEVLGVVRDENGKPVPGAVLTYELAAYMPQLPDLKETYADPDGHFRIASLPPGRHTIWAQDPAQSGRVCRARVDVAGGTPTIWNPVLERADGIRVRLVDEADAAIETWIVDFLAGSAWRRSVLTGPDGRAAVYDLPAEKTIAVHVRGRIHADRFPRAVLAAVDPSPDEHTLVVTRADPAGSVSATVLDDRERPPEDATAWLVSATIWHGESEPVDPSSGEFAFAHIADGSYDLMVVWGGHGRLSLGRVEVADGAPIDLGLVRLPPTGRALIDWSWPRDAAHADLRFALYQGTLDGTAARVLKGLAPPPEVLELLPGPYVLMVERDVRLQWRSFEVEPGREVRVESGPGLGDH